MKSTGRYYYEVPISARFGPNDTVRMWTVGKGRNARIVTSGGGRLTSTPVIRARRGGLKSACKTNAASIVPRGFSPWGR